MNRPISIRPGIRPKARKLVSTLLLSILPLPAVFASGGAEQPGAATSRTAREVTEITDGLGRTVTVPEEPEHVICSGAGCLRLLSYLQCQDAVIAVDDMESRRPAFDARPYVLANPQFRELPIFGEFRGFDNPELIVALDPQPDVIFKTYPEMGTDPVELQAKTGVPVITLQYGDLYGYRDDLYSSLRTVARVMGVNERAEEIIDFFENAIDDLEQRTGDIPDAEKTTCYVGGIAYKGPHGLQSTEPAYPPFMFINARNVAHDPTKQISELQHADVAKEMILAWNPEVLFVDVSTLQSAPEASALYELANDTAYRRLDAVRNGAVYGVLPYNWYTRNFGSILADAYFIGTVLYPERFGDIDPVNKADEIYTFLLGEPLFDELNSGFNNLAFTRLEIP